MARKHSKKHGPKTTTLVPAAAPVETRPIEALPALTTSAPCCVCGLKDARALLDVELAGGARVVLCGSHDLVHKRLGATATSVFELRAMLADRRRDDRRGHGTEEIDELAASLASAFGRERRSAERRAI